MQRVLKTMPKAHPDYKRARKELSAIFGKVKQPNGFETKELLSNELEKWAEKFSNPSNLGKLTDLQKIKYIGIFMELIIIIIGSTLFGKKLPKDVSKSLSEPSKPVVTKETFHQIKNLSHDTVLNAIWRIREFDFKQGYYYEFPFSLIFGFHNNN